MILDITLDYTDILLQLMWEKLITRYTYTDSLVSFNQKLQDKYLLIKNTRRVIFNEFEFLRRHSLKEKFGLRNFQSDRLLFFLPPHIYYLDLICYIFHAVSEIK